MVKLLTYTVQFVVYGKGPKISNTVSYVFGLNVPFYTVTVVS